MKKIKKGFSLAELLICLTIIAIIATFGFTITKHSIDKAYDRYIYTGYRALYDAILETNAQGYEFTRKTYKDSNNQDQGSYIYTNFINYIAYLLNKDGSAELPNNSIIEATNGITYTIKDATCITDNDCSMQIKMEVPCKKKIESNKTITKDVILLGYYPQKDYGILIPLKQTGDNGVTIDVYNRIDLLPFYLDDGVVGRVVDTGDGNKKYHKRTYYSAEGALCKSTTTKTDATGTFGYDCSNTETIDSTIIKPIDPRKLH